MEFELVKDIVEEYDLKTLELFFFLPWEHIGLVYMV